MATTALGIEAARELDELYRDHAAEVFRYAYAVLGNRADAEDVTQTTFVNALRALERGERPRTPKNWLITIAHNLIRQRFRQLQSRPREVELDLELAAPATDDDGPSLDDLVRALQRIPPTQREALVLRELEGRSYSEISALLGVSQSALETLIFRARRSLAEELDNLVTCDGAELALSRATDDRLGRKERRRLLAHLDECQSCARTAARSIKHRRAFKALAVLPLPFSLTLFKGAPSASAAVGLPTIGAAAGTTVAAGTAAGVTAKVAVGLAAVAIAGGAGYEGVQAVNDSAPPPARAAKVVVSATATPIVRRTDAKRTARPTAAGKSAGAVASAAASSKPARTKSKAANPSRGRSAIAPGQVKKSTPVVHGTPAQKAKASQGRAAPAVERAGTKPVQKPKPLRPARPERPAAAVQQQKPKPVSRAKQVVATKSAPPEQALKPPKPEKPAANDHAADPAAPGFGVTKTGKAG